MVGNSGAGEVVVEERFWQQLNWSVSVAGYPVGTISQPLMDEAKKSGWNLISMKEDWKRIYPFDK